MGLFEALSALKASAERQLHALNTKKKTENALLLPFLDALGYDPFNVREVEPEHAVELKEGSTRTVDYAVNIDGAPAMLFQCEDATADLDALGSGPLFRHFGSLDASIVVRTNGLNYQFYADFGAGGDVDGRPFLTFDLLDYEPEQIPYLERLTKPEFDTQEVLTTAFKLKHTRLLHHYFVQQREALDKHFVRFLAAQVYEGEVTEEILERFHPVVQKLLREFDMEEREIQRSAPSRTDDARSPNEDEGTDAEERERTIPQPENGEPQDDTGNSNGNLEDGKLEGSDLGDSELQGGSNIAKEFANKVIGDS